MYINCHTGHSFKYGTLPIKMLFEEAKRCNVHKLALTEINNTSSWLDMLRTCNENRVQANGKTKFEKEAYDLDLAVGVEFRNENSFLYITLAKNNQGFEEINRFLSFYNREAKLFPCGHLSLIMRLYFIRSEQLIRTNCMQMNLLASANNS